MTWFMTFSLKQTWDKPFFKSHLVRGGFFLATCFTPPLWGVCVFVVLVRYQLRNYQYPIYATGERLM